MVNNAGIQHVAPIEEFPDEKWDAILAINLSSAFHATKLVLPQMRRTRLGPRHQRRLARTPWSPRPTRRPMSRPSTACSASPR